MVDLRHAGHSGHTVLHRANCATGLAVLHTTCRKRNLEPALYLLRPAGNGTDPAASDTPDGAGDALPLSAPLAPEHTRLELCRRARRTVQLTRRSLSSTFGLRLGTLADLKAVAEGDVRLQRRLNACVLVEDGLYVTHVASSSNVAVQGVEVGDWVLLVGQAKVQAEQLKTVLQQLKTELNVQLVTLSLTRTAEEVNVSTTMTTPLDRLIDRHVMPAFDASARDLNPADVSIERLVVPPPPMSSRRIAPAPGRRLSDQSAADTDQSATALLAASPSHTGLNFVRNVTNFVRSADEVSALIKQLSVEDQQHRKQSAAQPSSPAPANPSQAQAIQRDVMAQLVAKVRRGCKEALHGLLCMVAFACVLACLLACLCLGLLQ